MKLSLSKYSVDLGWDHFTVFLLSSLIAVIPLYLYPFLYSVQGLSQETIAIIDWAAILYHIPFLLLYSLLVYFFSKKFNYVFKEADLLSVASVPSFLSLVVVIPLAILLILLNPTADPLILGYGLHIIVSTVLTIPLDIFLGFMALHFVFYFDRKKAEALLLKSL
ncbi:MAG: hypothetical protein PHS02_04675, partial [Candidatus ainarchaeum sp.]|nr:hypothetical protein [Candidatus ainarchaeum sp.]